MTAAKPYTPETLADRWGVTGKHIRDLCKAGTIQYFRVGKLYRIPATAVDAIEQGPPCNTASSSTETSGVSSGMRTERQSAEAQAQPTGKPRSGHLRILRGPGNEAIVTR